MIGSQKRFYLCQGTLVSPFTINHITVTSESLKRNILGKVVRDISHE